MLFQIECAEANSPCGGAAAAALLTKWGDRPQLQILATEVTFHARIIAPEVIGGAEIFQILVHNKTIIELLVVAHPHAGVCTHA